MRDPCLAEWAEREKRGLPPHHSIDQTDVGFRFTNPAVTEPGFAAFLENDFATMEQSWLDAEDVRTCVTFADIPDQNYDKLPGVRTLRKTPPGYVAWLACDGKYFEKFGAKLLASIDGPAHVHLMDADPEYCLRIPGNHGVTIEDCDGDAAYYHSVRFCRFAAFLEKHNGPAVLLDVDAIAHRAPAELPNVPIGMRLRPGRVEPWNQCNASVVCANADGLAYFKAVSNYIIYHYLQKKLIWQIDQTALYVCWQKLNVNIHTLGPNEVDYDYYDGVIWCNSGRNKWLEEDPDRQTYRDAFEKIRVPPVDNLEDAARSALKAGNTDEAKRLYLRLLRRCFEKLPEVEKKLPKPVEKRERRVEKILYLPIEVSARELLSKESLAALMDGWQCVVGARWPMQIHAFANLPPGIILMKTANSLDTNTFRQAAAAGHLIAVLDEELFAMEPDRDLYALSVDRQALDLADLICAQSPEQAELYSELTETKVVVTGNPRTQTTSLPGGDTVVICTMAGTVNNFGRSFFDMVESTCRVLGETGERAFDLLAETIVHEIELLPLVHEAIEKLTAAGKKVLIRPHPVEDAALYDSLGQVDDRTPFTERLADAECVVFCSGCGTGYEAALHGVPSVRLGDNGHGVSKNLGTTHNDIVAAVAQARPEKLQSQEVTLHAALKELQAENCFDCTYFDIEKSYADVDWEPAAFHANKIPEDPKGQKIGWRTSLIHS